MILSDDECDVDKQADKLFDQYFLGEIENNITDDGRYKIINSYKACFPGNDNRYLFAVLNTITKNLSIFDGCKDLYEHACLKKNTNQDVYINIDALFLEIL